MFIILFALLAVLVVGIVLIRSQRHGDNLLSFLLVVFPAALLVLILFIWPINYYSTVSSIQVYHSIKQTIQVARYQKMDEIERAALTHKIVEVNAWLAKVQYWNQTIFDEAIPDEVMGLEPLR